MYPGDGCILLLLICTLKGGSNHEFLHVYFSQLKKVLLSTYQEKNDYCGNFKKKWRIIYC